MPCLDLRQYDASHKVFINALTRGLSDMKSKAEAVASLQVMDDGGQISECIQLPTPTVPAL